MALLETKNVTKAYGALLAVSNVSFLIKAGKIHSIIGPNGAGKTTFFNLLAGVYSPTSGDIVFEGKNISSMKLYKRARIGIGRSYQVTSIFPELTVRENVRVAVQAKGNHNFSLFRPAESLSEYMDKTNAILEEMGLIALADQIASTIPYGSQRSLDMAIALATEPKLLLLDEPAAGMNPQETRELDELIVQIRKEEKIAILLIEHDMKLVMNISDRIYVMEYGKKIAQGTPQEIRSNPKVIEAYLGEGGDDA